MSRTLSNVSNLFIRLGKLVGGLEVSFSSPRGRSTLSGRSCTRKVSNSKPFVDRGSEDKISLSEGLLAPFWSVRSFK